MIRASFTAGKLALAALLILGAAFVGWAALRAAAIDMVSGDGSPASAIFADQPEMVLQAALNTYAANKGTVSARSLPSVRRAAIAMPLDDRPYLLIGSDYLQKGQNALAVRSLEAGRRLDPRQRWIHLLLLERYLRAGRFAPATQELAVLARLVGPAQAPIATALAQMSVAPETRDAVHQTLRRDTPLEISVLGALAASDVDPSTIFAMASPAALSAANATGGWGNTLVDRLVKKQKYRAAHAVWQRINRLDDRQVEPLLYDAGLTGLPGNPPFNWRLDSGNVAAVDMRGNALQIDYYGRDAGDLVSQLLVLQPGQYRFTQMVTGSQQVGGSALLWAVECDNQPNRNLARTNLSLDAAAPRNVAATFTVPDGCPAQRLRLAGMPGEFPTPVSVTIERLRLERLTGK